MRKLLYAVVATAGITISATAQASSYYYGYSVCMEGDTFVGCVGPWATGFWLSNLEFADYAHCEAYIAKQKTLALQLGKQFPGGFCTK